MTVKELIEVFPNCDLIEVVVREKGRGQWIQGYRIGKDAKLYPCNLTAEILEKYHFDSYQKTISLKKGEEVDCLQLNRLPIKVICKDVSRIPDNVGKLKVCFAQPRHIPSFHREALAHNEFSLEVDCFPEGYVPEKEQEKTWELEGQMSIEEVFGING